MNALLLGLALAAGAPAVKEPRSASTPAGEWSVESSLFGGEDDGVQRKAPIDKVVITADRWIVVRNGDTSGGTRIKFDPTKSPPEFDFLQDGADPTIRGIYKLDGDALTVCYILDGDRPTRLESPPGSTARLMVLKRIKK